jgi:hypothetical protein
VVGTVAMASTSSERLVVVDAACSDVSSTTVVS